jgi:hypothetical protein
LGEERGGREGVRVIGRYIGREEGSEGDRKVGREGGRGISTRKRRCGDRKKWKGSREEQ